MILMLLASSPAMAGDEHVGAFEPAVEKPRMHFADTVSGKPFSKDPAFKVQMQGVAAAPLDSDFARDKWTQLNPDGPILRPELPWERHCIEAAAMARHDGRLYMFYAGGYNNEPQQIGVAVSDDGVCFTRLFQEPFLPNGPPDSWNVSESGHPYLFQDDDGQDYRVVLGRPRGSRYDLRGGESWRS